MVFDEGSRLRRVTVDDGVADRFVLVPGERTSAVDREPRWLQDGTLLVRGDTPLFLLERELGASIPESQRLSTVTGLLMERLGRLPEKDVSFEIGDFTARVLKVQGTAIESVKFTRRELPAEGDAGVDDG